MKKSRLFFWYNRFLHIDSGEIMYAVGIRKNPNSHTIGFSRAIKFEDAFFLAMEKAKAAQ